MSSLIQIPTAPSSESSLGMLLRGLSGLVEEKDGELYRAQQERDYYKGQIQSHPEENIIAEGKQNEFIAILNVIYEAGFVTCTKSEFFKRFGEAFGAPSLASNYSKALYNIKLTYKYDEIFSRLAEVAQIEKKK